MRKESLEQGRVGGDDGTVTRGKCSPAASAAVGRTDRLELAGAEGKAEGRLG